MAEAKPFHKTTFKLSLVPVAGRIGTDADPQYPKEKKRADCLAATQPSSAVPSRLPKGLIGSRCTANITIANKEFTCLLDTRSQVTTIPVSVYNQHFSNQPLKSLCDLLQVKGAAGHAVPYLEYVEIVVTFPTEFLGAGFNVSTSALVVPDVGSRKFPVLIGMNTLEPLYSQHLESKFANFQPVAHGYKAVLSLLQIHHRQQQAECEGVVKLSSKSPVVIPASHTVVMMGSIQTRLLSPGRWAFVEHPATPLPGGLIVKNSLITLADQANTMVPVILCNESDQAVTLQPSSIIADFTIAPQILSHSATTSQLPSKTALLWNWILENPPFHQIGRRGSLGSSPKFQKFSHSVTWISDAQTKLNIA